MARSIAEMMWRDALAAVARADQLHRDFFHPSAPGWEPPVDMLETAEELILCVALPGVRAADVDLVIGGGEIGIVGVRRLPAVAAVARVRRLEVPHGRFERRVPLPPGRYELVRRELEDGCLHVILRKLG